jgi:hypothetical protein
MALAGPLAGIFSSSPAPSVSIPVEVLDERKPMGRCAYSVGCGLEVEYARGSHADNAPRVMANILSLRHVETGLVARLKTLYSLDWPQHSIPVR